jgi:hypothetical protein
MSNVVLLKEARSRRDRAIHIRDLVGTLFDDRAIRALNGYAAELDEQAAKLEAQANLTSQLANDIRSEINKARATIAEMKDTLRKDEPRPE